MEESILWRHSRIFDQVAADADGGLILQSKQPRTTIVSHHWSSGFCQNARPPNMVAKTRDLATRVSAVSERAWATKGALGRGPRCRVGCMDICARGTRKRTG